MSYGCITSYIVNGFRQLKHLPECSQNIPKHTEVGHKIGHTELITA